MGLGGDLFYVISQVCLTLAQETISETWEEVHPHGLRNALLKLGVAPAPGSTQVSLRQHLETGLSVL